MDRKLEILLVEDNYADVRWLQLLLAELNLPHTLTVVGDGELALDFLRRTGTYASAPKPHLVLVDLNLPKVDGIGVLGAIKMDPELAELPVCVLTGSEREREMVDRLFRINGNAYVLKPIDRTKLAAALATYPSLRRIADLLGEGEAGAAKA